MTTTKIVALTDTIGTPCGAIVWWRLSGECSVTSFYERWVAMGGRPELAPNPPTPREALVRTLRCACEQHERVHPLPKGGCAIVQATGLHEENDLAFQTQVKVSLDENSNLVLEKVDSPSREEVIRELFKNKLDVFASTDISTWLVKMMAGLKAIPLRDTGGVYFAPESSRTALMRAIEVVHGSSEHLISVVPALRSAEAIDAISNALASEIHEQIAKLEEQVATSSYGAKGFRNKIAASEALLAKVATYEQALEASQASLASRIEEFKAAMTVALFDAEAEESQAEAAK